MQYIIRILPKTPTFKINCDVCSTAPSVYKAPVPKDTLFLTTPSKRHHVCVPMHTKPFKKHEVLTYTQVGRRSANNKNKKKIDNSFRDENIACTNRSSLAYGPSFTSNTPPLPSRFLRSLEQSLPSI